MGRGVWEQSSSWEPSQWGGAGWAQQGRVLLSPLPASIPCHPMLSAPVCVPVCCLFEVPLGSLSCAVGLGGCSCRAGGDGGLCAGCWMFCPSWRTSRCPLSSGCVPGSVCAHFCCSPCFPPALCCALTALCSHTCLLSLLMLNY